jgi:hypothetical protein
MQAWNAIRRPFSATKIEPSGVNQTKAAPEGRNRKFSISGLVGALIAYGLAKGLVGKGHGLEFCALALAIWFSFWAFKKLKIAAYLVPTLAATTAHGIIFLLAAALAAYFDKIRTIFAAPGNHSDCRSSGLGIQAAFFRFVNSFIALSNSSRAYDHHI